MEASQTHAQARELDTASLQPNLWPLEKQPGPEFQPRSCPQSSRHPGYLSTLRSLLQGFQ